MQPFYHSFLVLIILTQLPVVVQHLVVHSQNVANSVGKGGLFDDNVEKMWKNVFIHIFHLNRLNAML